MDDENFYELAEKEKANRANEWNFLEKMVADFGPFIGGLATFLDPKMLIAGMGLSALARIHKKEDGWRINLFGRERPFGEKRRCCYNVTVARFGDIMDFSAVATIKETFLSQSIEQSYLFSPKKQGHYDIYETFFKGDDYGDKRLIKKFTHDRVSTGIQLAESSRPLKFNGAQLLINYRGVDSSSPLIYGITDILFPTSDE